jgi:hypothetical protein
VRTAVVVVVPAHDEEQTIAGTLRTVTDSLEHARHHRLVDRASIQVVAHRCQDRTAATARAAVGDLHHAQVTSDESSRTVGQVRDKAARRGLATLRSRADATWVLSTDADTHVGTTWVADILTTARRDRTVGVVGLADLDHWAGNADGHTDYQLLLASKMRPGTLHAHDHVYGANLGVRADAYLDVGGFPDVRVGEDQALVDALTARGHRLSRTTEVRVVTSGRLRGRAPGGLADHLARLAAPAPALSA